MEYINADIFSLLDERNTETENGRVKQNLSQIHSFASKLKEDYARENWSAVAVELRRFSDFTKSIYKTDERSSITEIQKSQKWTMLLSIKDSRSLRQIAEKLGILETNAAFEELDAVRDYANQELHPQPYKQKIQIGKHDLPSVIAVNFLLKLAIAGTCFEEPPVDATETVEWEKIFGPVKVSDTAREELEKPHFPNSLQTKIPLDSLRERQVIADDLTQFLFNGKALQYITPNNSTVDLMKALWNADWVEIRKKIRAQLSTTKKATEPQKWYQLSLSEAWVYLQQGKKDAAIKIWESVIAECPETLPHIRKVALMGLEYYDWRISESEKEINATRLKQLQEYRGINLIEEEMSFDKSGLINTVNREFDFKHKKVRSLFGGDNRAFFIYHSHLGHWIHAFTATTERGLFFILPELLDDLLELSITQQQYYPRVDQYFYQFYKIARNINRFNNQNIENYLKLLPLWDLQNHLKGIQPLIEEILHDSSWKVIDLKLLRVLLPILTNEQKKRIITKAKSFFNAPKRNEKDTYAPHALYQEYLDLYFDILKSSKEFWGTEQKWAATELCAKEQISMSSPLFPVLRIIGTEGFTLDPGLLNDLTDLINNYKDSRNNPLPEHERISSLSLIYFTSHKKLPIEAQEDFKKYPSLWLFSNAKSMPPIAESDIQNTREYLFHLIESFKQDSMDEKFSDTYDEIPIFIGRYIRLIQDFYKISPLYDKKLKEAVELWDCFLKTCSELSKICYRLFINIQQEAIALASDIKNISTQIDCLCLEQWNDKLANVGRITLSEDSFKDISQFLEQILRHLFFTDKASSYELQYLLSSMSWHQYFHCKQAIVFWEKGQDIPINIKTSLKFKLLDLVISSQNELISADIVTVYKLLFKGSVDIQVLDYLKDKCAFPLYYEIIKDMEK